MGPHRKRLCILALIVLPPVIFGSPLNSKLLPLVPPGAGIVAGFENYSNPHHHGQLLLSTHSNRLDLADWMAITGVDDKRRFDEAIEVACSHPAEGSLTEHLLLVEGRFDGGHIYQAAELNGAEENLFGGETILVLQPFAREKSEMNDLRWFVILENRIGMLGSPSLVKQALQRYQAREVVDPALAEQLAQLPPDVSSWNVLLSRPAQNNKIDLHSGSRWFGLLDQAEMLLIGARFGPKIRVDFLVRASQSRGSEFFQQKLTSFHKIFAGVLPERSFQPQIAKGQCDPDRVRGSIELSKKQFEIWSERGTVDRGLPASAPQVAPNGD